MRARLAELVMVVVLVVGLCVPVVGSAAANASAVAAAASDTLAAGQQLTAGQSLISADRRFSAVMQGDGNFVVYGPSGARWNTGGGPANRIAMQSDGNLVAYSPTRATWSSRTAVSHHDRLVMQSDGNLVIYSGNNIALWVNGRHVQGADTLGVGQQLTVGQSLISTDGRYSVVMQGDGNFVVYGPSGARWNTGGGPAIRIVMQGDGNLVAYSPTRATWSSRTAISHNDRLAMQSDGNLVIYDGSSTALWSNGRLLRRSPSAAVSDAVAYSTARSVTPYLSVVDRSSGAVLAQTGNAQSQVASESIMKLLLASYYLVLYGGYRQTPPDVLSRLSYMLRYSDNDITNSLFSNAAIPTIASRYGLGRTTNATDRAGHWGAARITASDMTQFLYRASRDAAVGPWLIPVMSQTAPNGSDGFNQAFGMNALSGTHGSKQGWGCDSFWTLHACAIHSVGYTDTKFVAILQLSDSYPDPARGTATHSAQVIQASGA